MLLILSLILVSAGGVWKDFCLAYIFNPFGFQAGHVRLIKPYMIAVQSNNVTAVNEALNEIYIEEEDYDRLRESIDLHDSFDQIGLAQKVSLKLRRHFKSLIN